MQIQKMLQGGKQKPDFPVWGLKVVAAFCGLRRVRQDEALVLVPGFVAGEVPVTSICRPRYPPLLLSLQGDRYSSETAGSLQGGHSTEARTG